MGNLRKRMSRKSSTMESGKNTSFDWRSLLKEQDFDAAPVSLMKHAPLSEAWNGLEIGTKVEVLNKTSVDGTSESDAYWIASVIKIRGYLLLLRFEGLGSDDSADFWTLLGSPDVRSLGWFTKMGKSLIPPKCLAIRSAQWSDFLVTVGTTIPSRFWKILQADIKSRYETGDQLEVVDKECISRVQVATVIQSTGCRLLLEYKDSDKSGFWCHEESQLLHPKGWAKTIGHHIVSYPKYNPPKLSSNRADTRFERMGFCVGMKLEAIDPLCPGTIGAATVKKVLKRGYIMIRIDSYEDEGKDAVDSNHWFCYHVTSPLVFPCGFCVSNDIILKPPFGYTIGNFQWSAYFEETDSRPAPIQPEPIYNHGFRVGMKLEVAELMLPENIYVGTITRIVGHLLKIHFDGWDDRYDQWMDCRSPDIYPVGWCELVGYTLQPPLTPRVSQSKKRTKKLGGKRQGKRQQKGCPPAKRVKLSITPVASTNQTPPQKNLWDSGNESIADTPLSDTPDAVNQEALILEPSRYTCAKTSEIESEQYLPVFNIRRSPKSKVRKPLTPPLERLSNIIRKLRNSGAVNTLVCKIPGIPHASFSFENVDPTVLESIDVVAFLQINGCGAYAETIQKMNITARSLLDLSEDQIFLLPEIRVGPAVKIWELVRWMKSAKHHHEHASDLLETNAALEAFSFLS